jgi:succinate dehydrogenase flavin-adding protein (antitoxin of CptAB toxin-antitoxin module)
MSNYQKLSTYICWNNNYSLKWVSDVLKSDESLDVMQDDGKLFWVSIELGNIEITKALLDYFEEHQLSKYQEDIAEYHLLKCKMRDILEVAIEDVELTKEMEELLSKYIDFSDENEERENEIKELDNLISFYGEENYHSIEDNDSNYVLSLGDNINEIY